MLKPGIGYKVGINNNPTEASAAFSAVYAAALANGGSFDNIKPGVDYFEKLLNAGNFVATVAGPSTVETGATNIVIWWDYLQASEIQLAARLVEEMEGRHPDRRLLRGLLRPGDQQGAPDPGCGKTVGGVPLLDGRPEPVARGRGPSHRASLPGVAPPGRIAKALAALPPAPAGVTKFPTQAQLAAAKASRREVLANRGWHGRVSLSHVADVTLGNEAAVFGPGIAVSGAGGGDLPKRARVTGLLRGGASDALAMAPFVIYTFLGLGVPTLAVDRPRL